MSNEFVYQARAKLADGRVGIITITAYDRADAKHQFAHHYWGFCEGKEQKLDKVDLRTVKLWEGEQ